MEAFEEKSQLDNEQPVDLGFQSDLTDPPMNEDKLKQIFTQELENVAICCNDETLNRDFPEHSVVPDEESEVKRIIEKEVCHLVVKEALDEAFQVVSSSEGGERNYQDARRSVDEALERHGVKILLEAPVECRVLEEREVGENRLAHEKVVNEVNDHDHDDEKVFEHKENELNAKYEFEIEGEHGNCEVWDHVCIDEEQRSENGEVRNSENEELESESETAGGGGEGGGLVAVLDDGRRKRYHYPLRPDAEDCSYYMRTGMCKFGSNCKFNHPLRRRNQSSKETVKHKEEDPDRPRQMECKFYLLSGGCKYGKACKYNHSRGITAVTPVSEYNFLGLPIRPGEKECPYYIRNGSCKYGPNCRFNHPDPTAVGGGVPATYENGFPVHLQSSSQTTMFPWSAPRTPNQTAPFIPVLYSPTHSMPAPTPDWNGYQASAPVYLTSERSLPTPPAFFTDKAPSDTNLYTHHQQQMPVSDFPERPGQLECSYFMKTGDCKYRLACKFHHPKSRIPMAAPSVLSNKGLPLRPDQNICTHYSCYGSCKYGPACKYDHPVNYSNYLLGGGYQPDGVEESLKQQSV